ncbi:MAG: alkyl hydroperoxide reductase [Acidobacteriales bacterium 59-55]|nr:carboxymuconolactone decarboxylase family protein [Terriglobales bacterium]ODU54193.1 MAG: alkyl hydroperoxide reductase [Granulicella sp. SCN 62-9]OJV43051.1 MAG: alkyl hydroperoxide reductase [Acidobacteriales bacterium 59-55]
MALDELIGGLPAYAKDLRLNYSSLVKQSTDLTPQQLWGSVVVAAIATRNGELTTEVIAEAEGILTPGALDAAKAAAAIMGMNNIYYRFHHLTSNEKYATLPARLRMNVLRGHTVEHVDFELWCLVVSAINACGKCVDSHEKVLREKGATEELINAAVRVASVIHAIGVVLDSERASPTAAE